MDLFLTGFVDELIKVGGPWGAQPTLPPPVPRPGGGIVRPPSTGTPGTPAPKPPNAFGQTAAFNQAIPTQKLESPAKAQPQQWRPSPGFRPSTAGDPTPNPAKPTGGKKVGGGGTSDVPWETAPNRMKRIMSERAYNKNLANTNANNATTPSTTSRKSYKLTPQEISANQAKKNQTVAKAETRYNAPANKMERWGDANAAAGIGSIRDGRMGGAAKPSPQQRQVTVADKVRRLNAQPAPVVNPLARVESRTPGGSARWR